jgi:hypothetical protein
MDFEAHGGPSVRAHLTPPLDAFAERPESWLRATEVVGQLENWGFLAHPDLPDGPGPAFLLVALRPLSTLRHDDPEAVDYWVTNDARGERQTLGNSSPMPRSEDYSWGLIRLVDRLGNANEYWTFGGHLDAALIDDAVVAAFASSAPLRRRGGHAHGADPGAEAIEAFFSRTMRAGQARHGFETSFAGATPLTRYAVFVRDTERRRHARGPGAAEDDLGRLLRLEATRLRGTVPAQWEAARALLHSVVAD